MTKCTPKWKFIVILLISSPLPFSFFFFFHNLFFLPFSDKMRRCWLWWWPLQHRRRCWFCSCTESWSWRLAPVAAASSKYGPLSLVLFLSNHFASYALRRLDAASSLHLSLVNRSLPLIPHLNMPLGLLKPSSTFFSTNEGFISSQTQSSWKNIHQPWTTDSLRNPMYIKHEIGT